MAHQLATSNGRISMMYHGETPWHRLGTMLSQPPTSAEAMAEAGLDYEVIGSPVYTRNPQGVEIPLPDHRMNVRADDGRCLGMVSRQYRVIQNREAFNFLDALVAEGDLRYHTAGALGDGERVWMLAKLPREVRVRGTEDVTEQYLLLSNSHDGSQALRCFFTPIRVVCNNTLTAAIRGHDRGITIRHTGDIAAKVDQARQVLGLAAGWFDGFGEGADAMAGHRPGRQQLASYFERVYPDPAKGDPAKARSARMTLQGLYTGGMGADMPGVEGTTWAAFNAVSELVDHHVGSTEARRLESAWWGEAVKVKERAWAAGLELVAAGTAPLLNL